MIVAACPHCRLPLQIDPAFVGQTLHCPKCAGGLIAPLPKADRSAIENDIGAGIAIWLAIITCHGVAWFAMSLWLGACASTFLVAAAATCELFVWQVLVTGNSPQWKVARRRLQEMLKPREDSKPVTVQLVANRQPTISETRPPPAGPATTVHASATRGQLPDLPTSEVAESRPQRWSSERIPQPRSILNWFAPTCQPLNALGASLPGKAQFLGLNATLRLDRAVLQCPMVYASSAPQYGTFDASLIDGTLPVAPSGSDCLEKLPYWPSYHAATPEQRSRYLDWLAGGRKDPSIEIGYVFIYFYGLERRILVDNAEHAAVAEEILDLRSVYETSRSFYRYSTSLLWMIVALTGRTGDLPGALTAKIVASTKRWDTEELAYCLANVYESGKRLSPELAFLVAKHDHRTAASVVVRRHEALFRQLFTKRYVQHFQQGMELRASKRSKQIYYKPASETLIRNMDALQTGRLSAIPDVLAITSQFKPLLDIWDECITELKDYDRAKRQGGDDLSSAAYEALPEELRLGEHPEHETWTAIWRESQSDSSEVPLVSVCRLAAMKGITERRTLLKSQCAQLLKTADCLGIGIEPDARLTRRNYRWDETVALFRLPDNQPQDDTTYQAASSLLQLGLHMAEADGSIDNSELVHIARHLEDQFSLSETLKERLEAFGHLIVAQKPEPGELLRRLEERLSPKKRLLVGEYLVGVAAADLVITPAEQARLQRIFSLLGLPGEQLEKLLMPLMPAQPAHSTESGEVGPPAAPTNFYLDMKAVSRIMQDTEAVASILKEAMEVDHEDELQPSYPAVPPPKPAEVEKTVADLARSSTAVTEVTHDQALEGSEPPQRFRAFFDAIVARDQWSTADARQLAKDHGVMLAGAIEAINEWSQERFGDWLVEEGDSILIHRHLLSTD